MVLACLAIILVMGIASIIVPKSMAEELFVY